jgi:hypothetical protein
MAVSTTSLLYRIIIFANSWQLLISILYIQYNSLLTSMLVNSEWQSYATKRKPFRVTTPVGYQRSTYFISLPVRYTAPVMILFSIMHWTLSQSVFLVYLQGFASGGYQTNEAAWLGFSVWPIISCELYEQKSILICSWPLTGCHGSYAVRNGPLSTSCFHWTVQ